MLQLMLLLVTSGIWEAQAQASNTSRVTTNDVCGAFSRTRVAFVLPPHPFCLWLGNDADRKSVV